MTVEELIEQLKKLDPNLQVESATREELAEAIEVTDSSCPSGKKVVLMEVWMDEKYYQGKS